jgi:MFS family permease
MNAISKIEGVTAAAAAAPSAPGRAAQATLVLVGSLVVMATAVVAPALPAIETHFAGQPGAAYLVRLIVTLPALVIAVAAPLAGYVLDRLDRWPVVFWALAAFVVFGAAGSVAGSLEMLLATRAGLGLSVAFLMAGFTSLIGDMFEPQARGAIMSRQVGANSIVALSMILMAGVFAEMDWRGAFLIYLAAAPLVIAFWLFVPRSRHRSDTPAAGAAPAGQGESMTVVMAVYALALLCPLLYMILPTQSPFLIAETYDGTPTTIALAFGASTLGVLPGSLAFGRLRGRLSTWSLFGLGFSIMGLGMLLQGIAPNLGLLVAAMGFSGIGFGLVMPNLSTTLLAAAPAHVRGRLSGGLVSSIFLGQFLSPVGSQPVVDAYGYPPTFLLGGLLLCVVALVAFMGAASRRRT